MRAEMGKDPSRAPPSQLNLPPGFRFYPTDEELVVHYLCKKAALEHFAIPIIAEIELYKFDPWDLPDKALFGEKEWYFFSPRDRKYPNGSRPNRAAGTGYWKATGTDKPIHTMSGSKKVGVKKALVFYRGKAPKGVKTNWIMHEYRLADGAAKSAKRKGSLRLDDWVLCRIYKKCSTSTQKAAIAKEQSESSCLDSVLSPGGMAGGCDNMNRLQQSPNGLESIHEGVYVDDKRTVSLHDLYQNGPTSSQGAASFYTPTYNNSYMQQLQGRIYDQAMANQAVPQKQGGGGLTTNHEQQGRAAASVGDVSSPDSPPSNMYSSRHTSEGSMLHEQQDHVDDAAESTFNNATLNLYNMQQPALNIQCADADQQQQQQQLNGTFPQSLLYMNGGGLDAGGLLPSPTASSFLGPHSTFSTLLDEPYSSSFFPSSSTSSSDPLYNHMRPFSRGPHLPWDAPHINKPHFST